MSTLSDPEVRKLFEQPNYAVLSTLDANGAINSVLIWADLEDGAIAVNSAVGRRWPTNLARDPRVTIFVYPPENPYEYVEVRGTASGSTDGAVEHINRLTKQYLSLDEYPYLSPGEQRIKFLITPQVVRYFKQG